MLVLLMGRIYDIHRRDAFIGHNIFLSFTEIFKGFQATIRFCLKILKLYNVGIIDEKELCSAPLRWVQVA
jgi:hypothetical protein